MDHHRKNSLTENTSTSKGKMCQIRAFATPHVLHKREPRSCGRKGKEKVSEASVREHEYLPWPDALKHQHLQWPCSGGRPTCSPANLASHLPSPANGQISLDWSYKHAAGRPASSWNNRQKKASCKVYGKHYFSHGHVTVIKSHTTLFCEWLLLPYVWETFFSNIINIRKSLFEILSIRMRHPTCLLISVTLMQWRSLNFQPRCSASFRSGLATPRLTLWFPMKQCFQFTSCSRLQVDPLPTALFCFEPIRTLRLLFTLIPHVPQLL